MSLTPRELELKARHKNDFLYYSSRCLYIRPKEGALTPLILNKPQLYVHEKVERQRHETGRIRALILKGRQEGISTYIEARFYWRVTHLKGVRACILTHDSEATKNLFEMAERYHNHCPAILQPQVGKSNRKELFFNLLDSGYRVATANNKSTGRSATLQFLHGSEVAFWQNADEHAKGIMQTVPNAPDTEIFLESTANGVGNYFHQQWRLAQTGKSDFIPIFIPWFWLEEYQIPVDNFQIADDEIVLRETYGLSDAQFNWRRSKIQELTAVGFSGENHFKQEYPCTADEAFQMSGVSPFILPEVVVRARNSIVKPNGPLVIGVDPAASENGDDTCIIRRQGRCSWALESMKTPNTMAVVSRLKNIIDCENPERVFIDKGGVGQGVVDRLAEMYGKHKIRGINFGSEPFQKERYFNKRAEMWGSMKEWLEDEPVQIENSDRLQGDIVSVQADFEHYESKGKLKLKSKEWMKRQGLPSPDSADALALTFAEPVASTNKPKRLIIPRNYV
jgi:hypothetical protein